MIKLYILKLRLFNKVFVIHNIYSIYITLIKISFTILLIFLFFEVGLLNLFEETNELLVS